MNRLPNAWMLSLLVLAATASCTGGGADVVAGGHFIVLKTEPLNNGRLFLNDPIRIDFSNPVNLTSADLNSFSFQVLDQNGNPLAEQPTGRFALDRSPGDVDIGRRLLFIPRFPTNDTYDNGGFRPGRTYLVRLVGGNRINGTVLRDVNGRALAIPVTFQFSTADGTTPAQLFRNRVQGGPRGTAFEISPAPTGGAGVALNKLGAPPVELRLVFDQPLNPHSANVPVALDTNPLVRNSNDRGRVFLEYDDPDYGANTWIPADVDLEVNDLERAVLVLRPVGVLPNNAEVAVIVENTLEDISGESNVANPAYNRVFFPRVGATRTYTFITRSDYEPQFDAVVEDFRDSNAIDFEAPFLEPFADVEQGFLKAGFEFEGTRTELEYEPTTREVVLNTDFTQVVPKNGVPFNVSGGVFNFKNVYIRDNVLVRGQGTRPMVWLVGNDFRVGGTLSVRGGDGDRVNTLNSANFPAAGGVGACTGGNGGKGSPNSTARSMEGETGFGWLQGTGGGGRGGRIACIAGCGRGSGGGGGSLATQGDPWYKQLAGAGTTFQQQNGIGGNGCGGGAGQASRSLQGGAAGPIVFTDARTDNNFWGAGVNIFRQIRIRGELANPVGGGGGGGGGNLSNASGCDPNTVNFISDSKGAGGGGGGGVLVVKALHDIIIDSTGIVTADGGHGGGGEQAGSCNQGGGGGAGAGGMVILMAGHQIILHAKGVATPAPGRWTYAQNDYSFLVSADGGVCTTGTFSSPVVSAKYPASGQVVQAGTSYDSAPLGALGGMGVVQLMAPPGDPSVPQADSTNTVLDDNIIFFKNGVLTTGAEKIGLLAWRGFPNAAGVMVDDRGIETNIGANEGDIRPTPLLLPVPFSAKTRLRSKWIDTGASKRRPVLVPVGPRGIQEQNGVLAGPTYEFASITDNPGALDNGYVAYNQTGGESVTIAYPDMLAQSAAIQSTSTGASYLGAPAHRIDLSVASLGNVVDRYSQYEAVLLDVGNSELASFRIFTHTDRVVLVDATDGPLPTGATKLQVRAKFFKVVTNGSEGLGQTYRGAAGNGRVPNANVRIGFAFSQDPAHTSNPQRYPTDPNTFTFELADPVVQEEIRLLGAVLMQWDVTFNTTFQTNAGDPVPSFSPSSPRPELHFIRLPFRF